MPCNAACLSIGPHAACSQCAAVPPADAQLCEHADEPTSAKQVKPRSPVSVVYSASLSFSPPRSVTPTRQQNTVSTVLWYILCSVSLSIIDLANSVHLGTQATAKTVVLTSEQRRVRLGLSCHSMPLPNHCPASSLLPLPPPGC